MSQYDYEALDLSQMSKEAERLNKKPGESNFLDNFVPQIEGEGSLQIRILPRLKGKQLWCATRTHKLGTFPNERSFHCPRELRDTANGQFWQAISEDEGGHGDCPICQYYSGNWKKSLALPKDSPEQKKLQEYLRKMKPVERYYYNVIVRECVNKKTKKTEQNVGPLIWSVGKTIHQIIVNNIFGNAKLKIKRLGDVTHPTNGFDFNLVKTIKGDFPDYSQCGFEKDSTPAGDPDQWEKWMAQRYNIFDLRKLLTFEELEKALMVHTGRIKDTKSAFDTSKYDPEEGQMGGDGDDVRQEMAQTTQKPVVKQERKPEAAKTEQEIMTDPAFMAELDGIQVDEE
jgi:hypothetical protein